MDGELMAATCKRLHGGSVRDCARRLPDGWAECPQEARHPMPKWISEIEAVSASAPVLDMPMRFSGELCQDCGGSNVIRTGTCLTCQDCGGTSGGCS
jgi:hypothetical protein